MIARNLLRDIELFLPLPLILLILLVLLHLLHHLPVR